MKSAVAAVVLAVTLTSSAAPALASADVAGVAGAPAPIGWSTGGFAPTHRRRRFRIGALRTTRTRPATHPHRPAAATPPASFSGVSCNRATPHITGTNLSAWRSFEHGSSPAQSTYKARRHSDAAGPVPSGRGHLRTCDDRRGWCGGRTGPDRLVDRRLLRPPPPPLPDWCTPDNPDPACHPPPPPPPPPPGPASCSAVSCNESTP